MVSKLNETIKGSHTVSLIYKCCIIIETLSLANIPLGPPLTYDVFEARAYIVFRYEMKIDVDNSWQAGSTMAGGGVDCYIRWQAGSTMAGWSGLLHTLAGRKHHGRGGEDFNIGWQAGSTMAGVERSST